MPAGFVYKTDLGIDTCVGHFSSSDGKLTFEHDIGEMGGEHGGVGESETLIGGSRVRIGRTTFVDAKGGVTYFSTVSFPDCG